ncbi:unnamed protein product [Vitrella brassicaformis CCMP3155]|uniref:TPM domain-containing protein n=2 Tax=Vitrella brassicaformis TaxID=1169539 RepID=A0A0G4GAY4_VITBC|nr:unnamed protein product [Vitrella brassicaformis CCMP3155]|eukprot:CEM26289.1 unnamed protein product [Vitrella brassicaformis CCMP3155]
MRLVVSLLCACAADGKAWRYEEYPDPITQPFACGQKTSGWICDPDGILSRKAAEQVSDTLRRITSETSVLCGPGKRPFEMGVALMQQMSRKQIHTLGGYGTGTERFAEKLGNHWAIGNGRCNNGILMLISKDDSVVYVKTGTGAQETLKNQHLADVIQRMRPALRKGDYDAATVQGVEDIFLVLKGEFKSKPVLPIAYRVSLIIAGCLFFFILPLFLIWLAVPIIRVSDWVYQKYPPTPLPSFTDFLTVYFGSPLEVDPTLPPTPRPRDCEGPDIDDSEEGNMERGAVGGGVGGRGCERRMASPCSGGQED